MGAVLALGLAVVPSRAQMMPTKVVMGKAEMREAATTITLVATIDAFQRSKVGSEIAGLVIEMPARQGDLVEAGDIICKLDDEAASLLVAEAKARLDGLKSRHEELLSGSRPQELVRLKAILDEAIANFDRWKFEMDRIQKLFDNNTSNPKEYADTLADFLQAERRKIASDAAYKLGVEGPRKEAIAQAAYDVAAQNAVVKRLESGLRKMSIRAPFTGYVVERTVEVGEWVSTGGQVVELIDLSSVLVRVDLPESALPFLKIGAPVRVMVDALGRSFEGKVRHIIPQAGLRARTFPVEIEVSNADRVLAGGMFARATVPAGPQQRVVAVPKDAIVERGGITYIATLAAGPNGMTGVLKPVTVGADVGNWIAITSGGVEPGLEVIVRGNESIMPFPTPVLVVDERGTPIKKSSAGSGKDSGGEEH